MEVGKKYLINEKACKYITYRPFVLEAGLEPAQLQ